MASGGTYENCSRRRDGGMSLPPAYLWAAMTQERGQPPFYVDPSELRSELGARLRHGAGASRIGMASAL